MLSHVCLRFKTEGLKQQETMDGLPKSIRSSIARYLFFPIVQQVYLFQGVSTDFSFQLVTEMQAEYFPPKLDVILQNEAPTDLYILVSGAVELRSYATDGTEQVHGRASSGDVFGEVGVLCYMSQPFTVRTTELSQILRLSRDTLMKIIQENTEDGIIIMKNLFKRLELNESSFNGVQHKDPQLILNERYGVSARHEENYQETDILEAMEKGTLLCTAAENSDMKTVSKLIMCGVDVNLVDANGRTALHTAVRQGNVELIKMLLEHGANMHESDACGLTPKAMAQEHRRNDIFELLLSYENKKKSYGDDQNQAIDSNRNILIQSNRERDTPFRYTKDVESMASTCSESEVHPVDSNVVKLHIRRVTIHMHPRKSERSSEQLRKLINLPDSLQELLRIGGQKFLGRNPTKVVNHQNAEIDDISVVRDGDHLFFLEEWE